MHPRETHQPSRALHPVGRMGEISDIVEASSTSSRRRSSPARSCTSTAGRAPVTDPAHREGGSRTPGPRRRPGSARRRGRCSWRRPAHHRPPPGIRVVLGQAGSSAKNCSQRVGDHCGCRHGHEVRLTRPDDVAGRRESPSRGCSSWWASAPRCPRPASSRVGTVIEDHRVDVSAVSARGPPDRAASRPPSGAPRPVGHSDRLRAGGHRGDDLGRNPRHVVQGRCHRGGVVALEGGTVPVEQRRDLRPGREKRRLEDGQGAYVAWISQGGVQRQCRSVGPPTRWTGRPEDCRAAPMTASRSAVSSRKDLVAGRDVAGAVAAPGRHPHLVVGGEVLRDGGPGVQPATRAVHQDDGVTDAQASYHQAGPVGRLDRLIVAAHCCSCFWMASCSAWRAPRRGSTATTRRQRGDARTRRPFRGL